MTLILEGRVTVNCKSVTEPSYNVHPSSDQVALDGRPLSLPGKTYLLLHKPRGVTSTVRDPHAARTVLGLIPLRLREGLHPVGRLDKETTGLLLLTNDGELTHRMSHPSYEVDKTYQLVLNKEISDGDMRRIAAGMVLDGKKTLPCRVSKLAPRRLEMVIHEGRKRQIRRVFELLHYRVEELARIRQGSLALGNLQEGQWRPLEPAEVRKLYQELHIPFRSPDS